MDNPFTGSYAAGDSVPAADVLMNAQLTKSVIDVLAIALPPGTTSISGTIEKASMKVGSQSVPLTGMQAPGTPINPAGTTLPVKGSTTPFTAVGGDQKVMAPSSFTFVPDWPAVVARLRHRVSDPLGR